MPKQKNALAAMDYSGGIEKLTEAGYDAAKIAQLRRTFYQKMHNEKGVIAATDIGAAQLFADRRGDDFRYVSEWKRWLRWDGRRWASASEETIGRTIIDYCRFDLLDYAAAIDNDAKRTDMMKFAIRCQSAGSVAAVRTLAANILAIEADQLDADTNLLNLQNGTLQLDTLELRPHRKADMLTKMSSASFDMQCRPRADIAWAAFLHKVIADADVRYYLQRAVGYSLAASVSEEKLFLLFGGGRNGKTTFINAIRHVLGDYAHEGDQQLLTYKSANMKGANNDATADLMGRRFVAVSETAEGDRLDEAKVKALVSNKPINAMRKYEPAFTFVPSHKLWIDTNHRPKIRGVDDGIWRRIAIIPFDVQIQLDDVDDRLADKLRAEADAIFRWALDGLRDYRERGLTEPTIIRKATAEYRSDSDTLRLFVAECLLRELGARVKRSTVFETYRRWLDANGFSFNLTAPAFNQRLAELGFIEGRTATEKFWKDTTLLNVETSPMLYGEPIESDERSF